MTDPMDFPPDPIVGQQYTAPGGMVYEWDGYAWTVGFYDNALQDISVLGGLVAQVRTLLQDTDNTSGQYRYSTDSIVAALNQGMLDCFRLRPDLFMANGFKVPFFSVGNMAADLVIEDQYVPPMIYYVVGLIQARDDEQNQDARATGFLKVFQNAIINGGLSA